ncbi:ferritin-like domain-containing protein [Terriglobus roseus]|uniref:Tat (Twin-arginine translocation) pathway signal sequence n=1 Tax=Terriglobus roseus TaxID=392734 RepID=A0A1G7G2L4_9BACT|nr:ferritin-like domain-containing protein [Terriglobus roseus]SDE82358.1 Tat (twin-arginine translocation) pathway signal sequence [Terriglobus roseus]
MNKLSRLITEDLSRRKFLAGAGMAVTALAAAGCGGNNNSSTTTPPTTPPTTPAVTDTDILNFALNLEYLEAEFYLRAATGSGLSSTDAGSSAGAVTGGSMVAFKTPAIQQYANEIANHELAHVRFLRKALGSAAVNRPAIDLTASFNAAASAAGIGSTFNPFQDENSFLLGAFVFEDVGVTAYHGAASLLTSTTNLAAAAGILATEAYHAGTIRTLIAQLGDPYLTTANKISMLRATAGGGAETTLDGSHIVAADSNSISYDRTTDQVLHIVYLSAAAGVVSKGGFYPNGMNGTIIASKS